MTTTLTWSGDVDSTQPEGIKTGIMLKKGERITVEATGWIKVGKEDSAWAAPQGLPGRIGSKSTLRARIGDGKQDYDIVNKAAGWEAPADGELILFVADSHYADNSGSFEARVYRHEETNCCCDDKSEQDAENLSPKHPDGQAANQCGCEVDPKNPPEVPQMKAPETDELYAIVLQDNYLWKGNKDDNGDIYSHDAKTGALKAKVVDSAQRPGQSNAITGDGYHYMAVDTSTVYRGKVGQTFELVSSISGGEYLDGFAFRQDDTGFMFRGLNNTISWFKHDPSTTNLALHKLTVVPGPGETRIAFGKQEEQWVTDIVFDGNDRAWLIGFYGDLWVVDDTRSTSEWKTRYLWRFPQLTFAPGYTRYIGIAFDAAGNLFLAGGQVEGNASPFGLFSRGAAACRRFIARTTVQAPTTVEVVYDGGPQSGSYGDLSSQAFPMVKI
ncbi:hypothetical protein GWD52_19125 [Enterobacteriaceae bacterium 4M9]|nr:hypothetical protein [Enterobacteriaceae bacterium 4M9]